jgi:fatty acid desaturase
VHPANALKFQHHSFPEGMSTQMSGGLHKRFTSNSDLSTIADSSSDRASSDDDITDAIDDGSSRFDTSKLWRIHDKYYDLMPLMGNHPGGPLVLEQSRGIVDATPLFESYHCLLDTKKIDKMMKRYEVDVEKEAEEAGIGLSFEKNGFYSTVVERVRQHFHGSGPPKKANIKAGWTLWMKVAVEIILWGVLYNYAFLSDEQGPLAMRCGAAFLAAVIFIQLGFQLMHDASHYAVSTDPETNMLIANAWLSLALWPGRLWHKHHVVHHHSFTGMPSYDPDVHHSMPFFRKSETQPSKKTLFKNNIPDWLVPILGSLTFFVFPGSWFGQVIVYHFVWIKKGYLWRTSLPELAKKWSEEWTLEAFIGLAFIGSQLYGCSLVTSFTYIVGLNTTYAACILPDHDTHETYENGLDREKEGKKNGNQSEDWGALQVTESANWAGPIFCFLFGGINYQIEHHLFPGVHHAHLPSIAPIVKKTCEEFNIPYVHHASLVGALGSFYQKITVLNGCGAK